MKLSETNENLFCLPFFSTAAIESFPEVHGVVGHPVTLPCTYPVSHGISPMCWGRGACFSDKCNNVVILTNGYYVYYERSNRYHLTGKILQGNVSLTIEKVTERDSGLYCCQLEMKRWNGVQRLTISLRVQPGKPALLLCLCLASEPSPLLIICCFPRTKTWRFL